jgi:hypothetical protein
MAPKATMLVHYTTEQLAYRKKVDTKKWLEEKTAGKNPDPKCEK